MGAKTWSARCLDASHVHCNLGNIPQTSPNKNPWKSLEWSVHCVVQTTAEEIITTVS